MLSHKISLHHLSKNLTQFLPLTAKEKVQNFPIINNQKLAKHKLWDKGNERQKGKVEEERSEVGRGRKRGMKRRDLGSRSGSVHLLDLLFLVLFLIPKHAFSECFYHTHKFSYTPSCNFTLKNRTRNLQNLSARKSLLSELPKVDWWKHLKHYAEVFFLVCINYMLAHLKSRF